MAAFHVIMNRVYYINKMLSLLSDNDTYETVNSDPLKKWQANFNRELKSILRDFPELEKGLNLTHLNSHIYMAYQKFINLIYHYVP